MVDKLVFFEVNNLKMVNESVNILVVVIFKEFYSFNKLELKLNLLLFSFLQNSLIVLLRKHH